MQAVMSRVVCGAASQIAGIRCVKTIFCQLTVLSVLLSSHSSAGMADEREEFFETQIRPLLLDRCVECHGPGKQENDIRFDRRDAVLNGIAGDVPLITPGNPEESRVLRVLLHAEDDIKMPPTNRLSEAQIGAVRKWIADGAVWPATANLEQDARERAERWRKHWAFQVPVRPDPGQFPEGVHPIDFYIGRKLKEKGLSPSPAAKPATLVRRLAFALEGLPPALSDLTDVTAAEGATSQAEWLSRYIERLLASPHFGERWARYWLDVSRYADTKGYVFQEDREYADAWRYRDWVISAINQDMPYDEFLKRQLAADRLPGSDDGSQLAAMGFLTLGRRFLNNRHDIIDDRIDVTMRGMLGLTVGCARCHDHKFDPIPTADYYSLYGIFDSSDEPKNEPSTLRLVDREKPVTPHIFVRGQPGNQGDEVPRRFLTALSKADAPVFSDGSGRLQLANAIASAENPLTARIAVNRIWMRLFGRGFVETPSDFGVRTAEPIHAELLDYLTTWFIDHQWSSKSLIRHIVSSQTWQQSSDRRADAEQIDPENRLFSRMNRRRLDFESHRDSLLAVSGQLDRTVGGKSVDIAAADPGKRRTIYARIDRQNLPGVFRTFDLANPDAHAPQRFETTVPQQALFQLNNPFVMSQAETLAQICIEAASDPRERIRTLFRQVLQRLPATIEEDAALAFLSASDAQDSASERNGWAYGYGTLDETTNRVSSFKLLPRFQRGAWQGGKDLPDPELGWVMLNRSGGHPGADLQHCAIRRFVVAADAQLNISHEVSHLSEHGNGIRVCVVSSAAGVLADKSIRNTTLATEPMSVAVKAGDWIDFVTDSCGDAGFDTFTWKIRISSVDNGTATRTWNSEEDFGRRQSETPLNEWSQLAQSIMLTNEFVFVD